MSAVLAQSCNLIVGLPSAIVVVSSTAFEQLVRYDFQTGLTISSTHGVSSHIIPALSGLACVSFTAQEGNYDDWVIRGCMSSLFGRNLHVLDMEFIGHEDSPLTSPGSPSLAPKKSIGPIIVNSLRKMNVTLCLARHHALCSQSR